MLNEGRVHILASDAHGVGRRRPNLREGRDAAAKWVGEEEAEHLVVDPSARRHRRRFAISVAATLGRPRGRLNSQARQGRGSEPSGSGAGFEVLPWRRRITGLAALRSGFDPSISNRP